MFLGREVMPTILEEGNMSKMAVREEMTCPPQFYIDKLTMQAKAASLLKPNAAKCRRW